MFFSFSIIGRLEFSVVDSIFAIGVILAAVPVRKISSDNASDYSMINHTIQNIGINYNIIVHIRPTTPIRDPARIDQAINLFRGNKNATSLRSVHLMAESAYKALKYIKKNSITTFYRFIFDIKV